MAALPDSGELSLDDIIKNMNLQPNAMPDLDSLSIMSGDSDKNSTK